MSYHKAVLLEESIEGLKVKEHGIYVDVTFGGGGHSRALLKQMGKKGKLIAFDCDLDSVNNGIEDERLILVNANFKNLRPFLKYHGFEQVDGILADLGVSSHQIDTPERGFSYRIDHELDMRLDNRLKLNAQEVLNHYTEEQLSKVFFQYGELKSARKIARRIVELRAKTPLKRSFQLNELLASLSFKPKLNKFLSQVYQAIRIEVNKELEALKQLLETSISVLNPAGRFSIISYHSLEDRLVKNFFKSGNFEGIIEKDLYGNSLSPFKPIGKLITPTEQEINENIRSRSAKLRIAEKI